jgi:hypothetical protein
MPTPLWKPGQCGNPKGRPRASVTIEQVRATARAALPGVLRTVVAIAKDEHAKDSDRLRAAQLLLLYGFGTPAAAPAETGPEQMSSADVVKLFAVPEVSCERGSEDPAAAPEAGHETAGAADQGT